MPHQFFLPANIDHQELSEGLQEMAKKLAEERGGGASIWALLPQAHIKQVHFCRSAIYFFEHRVNAYACSQLSPVSGVSFKR